MVWKSEIEIEVLIYSLSVDSIMNLQLIHESLRPLSIHLTWFTLIWRN